MKTLLTLSLALAGAFQADAARHFIVAVPPFLPTECREQAARETARLLYEPDAGTRVTVLDAGRMTTIAEATVPEGTLKLRRGLANPAITNVANAIRSATDTSRTFDAPNFLEYIGRQVRADGEDVVVVLMAPSLHHNPKDPASDMTTNWPSDGHLSAPRQRSVFSTSDKNHVLDNVLVSWFVTDWTAVANDNHGDGVARFWTLFIGTQGGVLIGYSPDLMNAFALARSGRQTPFRQVSVDRRDSAVVMRSAPVGEIFEKIEPAKPETKTVTNVVFQTNIVVKTNVVFTAGDNLLPLPRTGKTLIGCIWLSPSGVSHRIDLDLHVRVPLDGTELCFYRTNSSHGRYFRDVRESKPIIDGDMATSWEAVELDDDQLPSEAWIDMYSGRGPCQGEMRVIYKSKEYRIAFTFPAVRGDEGSDGSRRERSEHWMRIDLGHIVRTP